MGYYNKFPLLGFKSAKFPFVRSVSSGGSTNAGGSARSFTCPATVNVGDLLVVALCGTGTANRTMMLPVGWTTAIITNGSFNGNLRVVYVGYKIADGTEGGTTVSCNFSGTHSASFVCMSIGDAKSIVASAAFASGTASVADCPLLPTDSYANSLCLAVGQGITDVGTVSGWTNEVSSFATAAAVTIAYNKITSPTIDPPAFSNSISNWGAATLVIQGT